MPFAYVSGDPNNLVGGENASMTDIQGPLFDLANYLNSGIIAELSRGLLIVGEVRLIAVPNQPAGWLPCDGAAVSRATYEKLFAACGVTYGAGDGTNTFNVPDLRGRTPVGAGAGTGLTNRGAGSYFGAESVNLAAGALPAHAHRFAGAAVGGHNHQGTTNAADVNHLHVAARNGWWLLAADRHTIGEYGSQSLASSFYNWRQLIGGADSNLSAPIVDSDASTGAADRSLNHVHGINPDGTHTPSGTVDDVGQTRGAAHENMPPSVAIPAYIYAGT